MFCKICSDASNSGFNTHNVRDRAGNVVCPILLNTKCRGCGGRGHTISYCKTSTGVLSKPPVKKTVVVVVQPAMPPSNLFHLLESYDSDSDCVPCVVEDEGIMDFENDPIIWGVGLTSMVGKRWADVLGY